MRYHFFTGIALVCGWILAEALGLKDRLIHKIRETERPEPVAWEEAEIAEAREKLEHHSGITYTNEQVARYLVLKAEAAQEIEARQ